MRISQEKRDRSQVSPQPFYLPPTGKPTPSDIVRESRAWLQSVSTERPFTPRAHARSLFGGQSTNESRPVTASTIQSEQIEEDFFENYVGVRTYLIYKLNIHKSFSCLYLFC